MIGQPNRGSIDPYGWVLGVLEDFPAAHALPHRRLHDHDGALAGLVCEVVGDRPGPVWVLDACIDTPPFGDVQAWSFPPVAGDVVDSFLRPGLLRLEDRRIHVLPHRRRRR